MPNVRSVVGLLAFAVAPIYCIYSLQQIKGIQDATSNGGFDMETGEWRRPETQRKGASADVFHPKRAAEAVSAWLDSRRGDR